MDILQMEFPLTNFKHYLNNVYLDEYKLAKSIFILKNI